MFLLCLCVPGFYDDVDMPSVQPPVNVRLTVIVA